MYPASAVFLQAVQGNNRKYYWTGKITAAGGVEYSFDQADPSASGRETGISSVWGVTGNGDPAETSVSSSFSDFVTRYTGAVP